MTADPNRKNLRSPPPIPPADIDAAEAADQPAPATLSGTMMTAITAPHQRPANTSELPTVAMSPASVLPTAPPALPPNQRTLVTRVPPPGAGPAGATLITRAPGGAKTVVTDLNVGGTRPPTSEGSHTGEVWGDFEIRDQLGKGGMGSVYHGRQVSLDRLVAIKVLPPALSANESFRSRFGLEAKAVAQISSPHVVQVYAAGVHQGNHFFAMEYVEGHDLARKLQNGFRPTYRQSLELVLQAARGLQAAGEHGIIHRDIKPGNMMVTPKGLLKLMDFGLVKLAASPEASVTMAGTVMGTVNYFSPEQGRGEVCDQRTDLYALGVVFYQLLTGTLPFRGADATSVIYQHIHQQPRSPKEIDPNIPEDYQAVVLKCMQKRPEARYQNASALVADLEALIDGQSPLTAYLDPEALRQGATMLKTTEFRLERQRRGLLVGGLLCVLAAAAGGGLWWTYGREPASAAVVIATPERTQPAVTLPPATRDPAFERASALLTAGGFDEARLLVDQARTAKPDDAAWQQLERDLDRAHGAQLLVQARQAQAAGDWPRAAQAGAAAAKRLGDLPELVALRAEAVDRQAQAQALAKGVAEAQALLADGKADAAERRLDQLTKEHPSSAEVAELLRTLRSQREAGAARSRGAADSLARGEDAFARRDYDGALQLFANARALDPDNAAAKTGIAKVEDAKAAASALRERFQRALAARDLAAADTALRELRTAWPEGKQVSVCEQELASSRLVEDEKARRAADAESKVGGQAKTVLALINDPQATIPAMEHALSAFLANAGADRPEKALLETRIEDHRQLVAVTQRLAGLDQAVRGKDAAGVRAMVADNDFAAALVELSALPGLVFESRIDDFVRDGRSGQLRVSLRHALALFPERVLAYRYAVRQDAGGWVIAKAELVK